MRIEDGTGKGYEVKVNSENQISVEAVVREAQHHASSSHALAFQVSANLAIAASKKNLLMLTNNNNSNDMVITFMRLMSIGAAAASAAAFFTIETGGTYTSGGDVVTPTNMNIGQSVLSSVNAFDGGTTIVAADFTEIDRNYEANSMQSYNKSGAIVLKRGQSLLITHTGSTAAGTAYCRVSFYMTSGEA